MENNNKKVVLFDFDGVLIDTLITTYTIATETNNDLTIEEYKTFFDANIHDAIDASRANGKIYRYNPEFLQKYDDGVREIKIPEILKSYVKELSLVYTLVIVSSTPSWSIKEILAREDIEECFDDILGADVHKSKIIKIQMVLEKYAVEPTNCLFVTDTLGDIEEARKCQVPSIAVTWGFHEKENLEKGNPLAIIDDPRDLFDTIKNVLK